jgi:phosphatidylethanolamine/phosphatidyl-N-methylethanolamine N-methyltransferase
MPPATELSSPAVGVAKIYRRMAAIYDMLFGSLLNNGRFKLARALQLAPNQRIAELGIGSGLMLPLYPRDAQVVGVDISPEMLERARAKSAALGMRQVQLYLADAENTSLPAAQFDHVLLTYIYTVTPHPPALLQEAMRLCKPGGSVWILGYFSDMGPWRNFNWLVGPIAKAVGFQAHFPYAKHVAAHGVPVVQVLPANLFGMSRLVQIRKAA